MSTAERHPTVHAEVRLPSRAPLAQAELLAFLGRRAVPGVEEATPSGFRRSLRLRGGAGVVELEPGEKEFRARFRLGDPADLDDAIARTRALLDLDCDPAAVRGALAGDGLLGEHVRARPGLRVPGTVDGAELAVRAVIGQQISVSGARTITARIVQACGEPLLEPVGSVTHAFPSPAALAALNPDALPMPRARRSALLGLARALAGGQIVLDALPGAEHEGTLRELRALPGIGRWTADYVAMRALRDRDAFLATDLGVRRGLELLGVDGSPRSASERSERWRPFRAYATVHLWTLLGAATASGGGA
ncbi:MAG TPA: AlkA N-terminal domain-containing protein [Solirubrobacteraceae bacterium]|nr:AlkA N-terminal domain-containing protein [Solirubrobacteraceae bacterium]